MNEQEQSAIERIRKHLPFGTTVNGVGIGQREDEDALALLAEGIKQRDRAMNKLAFRYLRCKQGYEPVTNEIIHEVAAALEAVKAGQEGGSHD